MSPRPHIDPWSHAGRPLLIAPLAVLFGLSCSDSDSANSADAGSNVSIDLGDELAPGKSDLGELEDAGSGGSDQGTSDLGEDDAGSEPPTVCEVLGLPVRPFLPGDTTYQFGDVAGDFTVNQLDGTTWNLQQSWTGCDSFLFVTFVPTMRPSPLSPSVTEAFWDSSVEPLISTPVNAHYFFASWEPTPELRRTRVEDLQTRIEAALTSSNLTDVELARQRARFHYVTDDPRAVRGSVGALMNDYLQYRSDPSSVVNLGNGQMASPPFTHAVGIDREQRWDSVGSLAEFVETRPDRIPTWSFRMVSFLPAFYDYKAGIADRVATETGVDTHVLVDEPVTERIFVRTATLPAGPSFAQFDTLEFDVTVNCRERNVFACSEWDRIARIALCMDGSACSERRELIRWITPYWRRGERRWIMDASALLGYLGQGGLKYFRIEMGPGWERATQRDVRVGLRLSNQSKPERAIGALRAFSGGPFNDSYNVREPFSFTPPASARKVELVLILSGHGQDSNSGCSEWCDHRHRFAVNGSDLPEVRHTGQIGSLGCGPAAALGASPGQFGNWAPERAYWCPGVPVDHQRIDITSLVTAGQANSLNYQANFRGTMPPAGGNISLSAYVVWSE